jgi:hypothetical protein
MKSDLYPLGVDSEAVITVRLPKAVHQALRGLAFDQHLSLNQLCCSIIKDELVKAGHWPWDSNTLTPIRPPSPPSPPIVGSQEWKASRN